MAAPSWQDYYDAGKAEATLRRSVLTFNEGDITDMFMAAAAAMADRLTGYAADRFRATYLDGAQDEDLNTLANDHWSIVRNFAVKSIGQITLSRPTFTAGAGTYAAGSIVATVKDALGNDVQFSLDVDAVFGGTDLSKTVNVTCLQPGTVGNVVAGAITKLITPAFDSTIIVTNASPLAGGADNETDAALRDRVRAFPSTLRRGTLDALEYGAKTVAGVVAAHAIEDGTGITTVYVADVNGNSNPTMVSNVQAALETWRAAGALVYASGGSLYGGVGTNGAGRLIVTMQLTVKTGVDVNALIASIKAAIIATLAKLPPGGTAYRSQIHAAVINVAPDDIVNVDLLVPAADLQPGAGELIRTTTADITVS